MCRFCGSGIQEHPSWVVLTQGLGIKVSPRAAAIWKLDWRWRICFWDGLLLWLINWCCWLLARGFSSLTMGGLYQSCFRIFMTWGSAFQKRSDPRWKWQRLLWLGLVTQCHSVTLCWSQWLSQIQCGRGYTKV